MLNIISVILAAAAFAASIIVPAITNWQNNQHQREMFLLKFYSDHQAKAFSDYLTKTNLVLYYGSAILDGYRDAFGAMLLYLPEDLHDSAHALNSLIMNKQTEEAKVVYESFAKALHARIPTNKSNKR